MHHMQDFLDKSARAKAILGVIGHIGATIWFYWNQTLWSDMSNECREGYNGLDFYVWIGLLVLTLYPTLIVSLLTIVAILCCPCMVLGLCASR